MTRWLLHIETQQPMLIGSRFGNMAQNFQGQLCIPGQTLRGALAAAVVQRLGEEDPAFQACFGADKLACGPQWAVAGPEAPQESDVWGPLPFTAQRCKRFTHNCKHSERDALQCPPATVQDDNRFGNGNSEHTERDTLLDLAFVPRKSWDRECTYCLAPLEKWRGQAHLTAHGPASELHLQRQLITRTAVGAALDSVVHSQLFNLKPLSEGQHFAGYVFDPEDRLRKLLPTMETLYIGMGQTRGFGRVQATWIRADQPMGGPLKDRIEAFEAMLNQQDRHRPKSDANTLTRVTLNLTSPLLLRDAWGNDRLALADKDFHVYDDHLKWHVAAVASEATWVGGWHGLLGLPHNQRQALAPGSVFELKITGNRGQALTALETLETFGLGEGFANGFGHLLIAHPFHTAYAAKKLRATAPSTVPAFPETTPKPLTLDDLINDEAEVARWQEMATAAFEAHETDSQIRGFENLVAKAQGLAPIVNQLYNQIFRFKNQARVEWRLQMVEALWKCRTDLGLDKSLSLETLESEDAHFQRVVTDQSNLLRLIRGRMATFVAHALLRIKLKKDRKETSGNHEKRQHR